jgi:hypothetical protein
MLLSVRFGPKATFEEGPVLAQSGHRIPPVSGVIDEVQQRTVEVVLGRVRVTTLDPLAS